MAKVAYTSKLNLPTLVSGNPYDLAFTVLVNGTAIPINEIASLVAVFTPPDGTDQVFKTLANVTVADNTPTVGTLALTAADTEPWNGLTVIFEMRIVDGDGKPHTPYLGCPITFAENQITAAVAAAHP